MRAGHFKLHRHLTTGQERLFDLRTDPGEHTDVREKHPGVAAMLAKHLTSFLEISPSSKETPRLSDAERTGERGRRETEDGHRAHRQRFEDDPGDRADEHGEHLPRLRRDSRGGGGEPDQRTQQEHNEGHSPDDLVENLEIYALIMAFLESLTGEDQALFKTRFLGQCSQENTARRLGWNRAKVRKIEAKLRKSFLCHAKGSGYLEIKSESRKIRRPSNPEHHKTTFARSRAIWHSRHCDQHNEFLHEAA